MGQVSDRNGFRAGTRVRSRRVTARNGFWIGTGSVRIEFQPETGFDANRFDAYRFDG
ncbi:hypothetical protein Hanom_Chr14g01273491 [Helianthus anomalus]